MASFTKLEQAVVAGKYRLDRIIGRGGFSAVYRGEHLAMGRPVALKVLDGSRVGGEEASMMERFEREARVISQLEAPSTITVFDYGAEGDLLYLVMEFVDGASLKQVLAKQGRMAPERVAHLGLAVLESLAEAHHHGVLHRDLKPANIMVTRDYRGRDVFKVVDFGIAKVIAEAQSQDAAVQKSLTQEHSFIGTPRYAAPEQLFAQNLSGPTDLYGLGMVMWEALVGKPVLSKSSWHSCSTFHLNHRSEPMRLPEVAHVPAGLAAVVERAVRRKVCERWASAEEMLEALEAWLQSPEEDVSREEASSQEVMQWPGLDASDPGSPSSPSTDQGLADDSLVFVRGKQVFDPNLQEADALFGEQNNPRRADLFAESGGAPNAPPPLPDDERARAASARREATRAADRADSAASALQASDWGAAAEHIPRADHSSSGSERGRAPETQDGRAPAPEAPPPRRAPRELDPRGGKKNASAGALTYGVGLVILVALLGAGGALSWAMWSDKGGGDLGLGFGADASAPEGAAATESESEAEERARDEAEEAAAPSSRYSKEGILLVVQSAGWVRQLAAKPTRLGGFTQQTYMYRKGEDLQCEVAVITARSEGLLEEFLGRARPPTRVVRFENRAVKLTPRNQRSAEAVRQLADKLERYRVMIDEHEGGK